MVREDVPDPGGGSRLGQRRAVYYSLSDASSTFMHAYKDQKTFEGVVELNIDSAVRYVCGRGSQADRDAFVDHVVPVMRDLEIVPDRTSAYELIIEDYDCGGRVAALACLAQLKALLDAGEFDVGVDGEESESDDDSPSPAKKRKSATSNVSLDTPAVVAPQYDAEYWHASYEHVAVAELLTAKWFELHVYDLDTALSAVAGVWEAQGLGAPPDLDCGAVSALVARHRRVTNTRASAAVAEDLASLAAPKAAWLAQQLFAPDDPDAFMLVEWLGRMRRAVSATEPEPKPASQPEPVDDDFGDAPEPTSSAAPTAGTADTSSEAPALVPSQLLGRKTTKSGDVFAFDDAGYAQLRHMQILLRSSDNNMPLAQEFWSRFYTGKPADYIAQRSAVAARTARLNDADMARWFEDVDASKLGVSLMTDDRGSWHCLYVNFHDDEAMQLRRLFVTRARSIGKDSAASALTNLLSLEGHLGNMASIGGGTGDNAPAALEELRLSVRMSRDRLVAMRRIARAWVAYRIRVLIPEGYQDREPMSEQDREPMSEQLAATLLTLCVLWLWFSLPEAPERRAIAVGDDIHKTALIAKHVGKVAFGSSAGMGYAHHVQLLFILRDLQEDERHTFVQRCALAWAASEMGEMPKEAMLIPGKSSEARWQVGAAAAKDLLPLIASGFYPGFAAHMAALEKTSYRGDQWNQVALWTQLPEILAALTYEVEFDRVFFGPSMAWNRELGPYYDVTGFRLRELPHRVVETTLPFLSSLLDGGWRDVLVDTSAAIELLPPEKKDVMVSLMNDAAEAGLDEAEKLYASVFKAPISFCFLASPMLGPAAARALLLLLQGRDNGVTIHDADLGYADDDADWIRDLYDGDPDFDHWFGQLRFDRALLDITRLARMEAGEWWDQYRRQLPTLHRVFFEELDHFAHTDVDCETLFSKALQFLRANLSDARADMHLRYVVNEEAAFRAARVAESGESKGARKGHADTLPKQHLAGKQMLEMAERYSSPKMAELQEAGKIGTIKSYYLGSLKAPEIMVATAKMEVMTKAAAGRARDVPSPEGEQMPHLELATAAFKMTRGARARAEADERYKALTSRAAWVALSWRPSGGDEHGSFENEYMWHVASDSRLLPFQYRNGIDLGALDDTQRRGFYVVGTRRQLRGRPGQRRAGQQVTDLTALAATLRRQSASANRPTTWDLRDANVEKLSQSKGGMMELLFGVATLKFTKNASVIVPRDAVVTKSFHVGKNVTAVVDGFEYSKCHVTACDASANEVTLLLKKRKVKGYCALGLFGLIDLIDSFNVQGPENPTLARTVHVLPARGHEGCKLGEHRKVSDPRWANICGKLRSANGVSL